MLRRQVLDHGYVELVETWGSDERIIEAARMSTDKGFKGWGGEPCPETELTCVAPLPHLTCVTKHPDSCKCGGTGKMIGDEKLLKFLWEHKHLTPFEFAGMTIEVQAPIVVFREWHRHRTQSYNEMSGRYTVLPDLIYIPSVERLMMGKQSQTNKQGSEAGMTSLQAQMARDAFAETWEVLRSQYSAFLDEFGMARELARLVLPVAQYSRMRASTDLRNWLGFLTLRKDKAAQWEIRQYADVVGEMISQRFPRTWALFAEGL